MFHCMSCDAVFEEHAWTYTHVTCMSAEPPEAICPSCGSPDLQDAAVCPECGRGYAPDADECPLCGLAHYDSPVTCPDCGEWMEETKPCPHCGWGGEETG
jgi:predicted amidophosphoribosyltransferase